MFQWYVPNFWCLGYVESDDDDDDDDKNELFGGKKTILEWLKTKDSAQDGKAWVQLYQQKAHECQTARLKLCGVLMNHISRIKGCPSSRCLEKVAFRVSQEFCDPAVSYYIIL